MTSPAITNPQSPYARQLREGFRTLLFSGVLEEEFRKFYSQSGVSRARLLPCFAIIMTLIATVVRLTSVDPKPVMIVFDLFVFLPLLFATLYASTLPEKYRLYQGLLAMTGCVSGLVVISIVFGAGVHYIPFYFSMEVAWIFAIWLIIGLRLRWAATTALLMSGTYVFGLFYLNIDIQQAGPEIIMLFIINAIGAVSCYQLEFAERRSYLESRQLEELARELEALAQLDGLTSLNNRRSLDAYLERIWRQARREMAPLIIMLVDLDHYKAYNDHYGHQAGDDALKAVADVLSRSAKRPFDFAARYGGEEFVLVLYGPAGDTDAPIAESARIFAENICQDVNALKITHRKSLTDQYLTVSIGAAVIRPDAKRSLAGAVQLADEALYQAKEAGRNRVVVKESGNAQLMTGQFRASKNASV